MSSIIKNNSITIHQEEGNRWVVKEYLKKPFTLKALTYSIRSSVGKKIPVEYRNSAERLDYEKMCLEYWSERGFSVPKVLSLESDIALRMEYIEGPTLNQYLQDSQITIDKKLQTLTSIFQEMRNRHCYAIYENNPFLIHFDSNTRNIILSGKDPVYIDFEMGREEKIDRSAAREVKKLTLEILNQMGRDSFESILNILINYYGIKHILRRMADEELDRPLQILHKYRTRKSPLITKYDLAYALRRRIGTAREDNINQDSSNISKAETSSWDGKFYQSLDDSDPRGRDMPHRYQVMQFPKDFSGKSLLDIGCNLGRICIDAAKAGSSRAVGIDYRKDVMQSISAYCQEQKIPAEFYAFDINQGCGLLQEILGNDQFDIVCALAIWSHVDQKKLWEIINATCKEVCYFEDNAPSRVKCLQKVQSTLRENLNFSKIEFLGFTTDRGIRSVFRLTK